MLVTQEVNKPFQSKIPVNTKKASLSGGVRFFLDAPTFFGSEAMATASLEVPLTVGMSHYAQNVKARLSIVFFRISFANRIIGGQSGSPVGGGLAFKYCMC